MGRGGALEKPTYKQICRGDTGHAEVVQITYDPDKVSYEKLLEIFWMSHDPTTLNRQGADVGTQYRSIILYHDADQQAAAVQSLSATDGSDLWRDPIVTDIQPMGDFYSAEAYHQNYFKDNPNQPYCRAVIDPKVRKFRKAYQDRLKVA